MSIGVSLAVIALGAIFTFAVNDSPPGLNLHIVGLVLMTIGGAGLFLRMTGYGPETNLITAPRSMARWRPRRTRVVEERVYDPMAEDPTVYRPAATEAADPTVVAGPTTRPVADLPEERGPVR